MGMTEICAVAPHSPAARMGITVGQTLLTVNEHPVIDVLDYKFYTYDARLRLTLRDGDGKERQVLVRKQEGEDLGLTFATYLMDKARSCANDCVFCFVDQMPPGMRKSLYFKDDDTRLSFLMGNYLTLTNLSQREVERIIALRISPINVSVHTTNPELRVQMLKHPRAGAAIDTMRRFAQAGIQMNCQIVACPGLNDGAELDRTMVDLAAMFPAANSVSVVPVGVTKYRDKLYPLRPYTPQEAGAVIDQVEEVAKAHKERTGTGFIWCSDEFYLIAGRPLRDEGYFEAFTQLENGVGMLTLLRSEFQRALKLLDEEETQNTTPFTIATGVSAAPFLREMVDMARQTWDNVKGTVYAIRNTFFGETIVVSGLVTGGDLIAQLKDRPLEKRLLIPANMLRSGERVFLDDVTVDDVERALNVQVTVVGQDGYELCDAMFDVGTQQAHPGTLPQEEFHAYNPPAR